MPKPWTDEFDLSLIPESMVGLIEPELDKFYTAQQEKLQQAQEAQGRYEGWDDVVGNHKPEEVTSALEYAQYLADNPQEVFEKLAEHLGIELPSGEPETPPAGNTGEEDDPRFKQLQAEIAKQNKSLEQVSKFLVDKDAFEKAQKQEQELESYLKGLQEKNEEIFDRDFVISKLSAGKTGEEAIAELQQLATKLKGGTPNLEPGKAPVFLGSGSLPSNARPVTELSKDETVSLVEEIARAAIAASNS
jgi:hypothetical protein